MSKQMKIKSQKSYAKNRESKKHLPAERVKYINFLVEEFMYRRTVNIYYSLRNFARDLELDHRHLGRILKNEKGLSRRKAEVISRKLNLPFNERRKFNLLVSAASARRQFERNLAAYGLKNEPCREKLKTNLRSGQRRSD